MNKTFARQEFHFYTSLGSVTLFRTSLIAILIKIRATILEIFHNLVVYCQHVRANILLRRLCWMVMRENFS